MGYSSELKALIYEPDLELDEIHEVFEANGWPIFRDSEEFTDRCENQIPGRPVRLAGAWLEWCIATAITNCLDLNASEVRVDLPNCRSLDEQFGQISTAERKTKIQEALHDRQRNDKRLKFLM